MTGIKPAYLERPAVPLSGQVSGDILKAVELFFTS